MGHLRPLRRPGRQRLVAAAAAAAGLSPDRGSEVTTATIRPAAGDGLADFLRLPGAPDLTGTYEAMVADGMTRPEWCFVLEQAGRPVGWVGFRFEDTCPPQFLGNLPAREVWPFGLELP